MTLLGKKVTDTLTGTPGTIVGEAKFLFGNPLVLMAYGSFQETWVEEGRLAFVEAMADINNVTPSVPSIVLPELTADLEAAVKKAKQDAMTKALRAEAVAKGIFEKGAAMAAAETAAKPEAETAALAAVTAAVQTKPAGNPVATAVETYARVSKAFIALGKAGQSATIEAILKLHNAAHAKQIQTDPVALLDVAERAEKAVADLSKAA